MLNDTNNADWLESEILRLAQIERTVEVNPAVAQLHADCSDREFPQLLTELRTMVSDARRAAQDDVSAEETAQARETGEWRGRKDRVDMEDKETTAEAFLRRVFPQTSKRWSLGFWQGVFYEWLGPHWVPLADGEIEKELRLWLAEDCWFLDLVSSGPRPAPVKPNNNAVREIEGALRSLTWQDGNTNHGWQMPKPPFANPIPVRNGILDLNTLDLHPHSPWLFNTVSADADWEPDAPDLLDTFAGEWLVSALDGDAQVPMVQEMLGYLLSARTDAQKGFMIIGPKRSGKGTLGRVIGAMLGGNLASVSTRSFAGTFGRQGLLDKTVCLMPDMRVDKNTDMGALAETILTITGEDHVEVQRKNKTPITMKLGVRFLMLSNSVPRLRDADGVLYSRIHFMRMPISNYGKEDPGLIGKVWAQPSAWLKFAVEGIKRLESQNMHFTVSDVTEAIQGRAEARLDPVGCWIRDSVNITGDVSDVVSMADLWESFDEFAESNNIGGFSQVGFIRLFWGKDLDDVTQCKTGDQSHGIDTRVRGARGLTLGART